MSVTTYSNRTADPDAPDSGKVKFYMKGKVPHWRDDTGSVKTLQPSIFGEHFNLSVFGDWQQSTSGTNWDNYIWLQMPTGSAGTYLVISELVMRMSTTSSDAICRLAKNGLLLGEEAHEEFKDSSSAQSIPRHLFRQVTLADGDELTLDIATENGTLTVKSGSVILWRVA